MIRLHPRRERRGFTLSRVMQKLRKNSRVVFAKHIITGETMELLSVKDMRNAGFTPNAVYRVINGERLHHLKYRFSRETFDTPC